MSQPASAAARPWTGHWRQGLAYGGLGLPLAFVALPLYVLLPNHYASAYGVPLAWLGVVLLVARLLDALVDPWLGRLADRWYQQAPSRVWQALLVSALLLVLGFAALFLPPAVVAGDVQRVLAWCAAALVLTYLSFGLLTVVHQAWGARLGGDEAQRAKVVAWREGLALVGVLVASVLPALAGLGVMVAVFVLLLGLALLLLSRAPAAVDRGQGPVGGARASSPTADPQPLRNPAFRRLLLVYLVNGTASAVPATLVLFFIRDRLQAGAQEPLFLVTYFAAGALSMPLWVRLVPRLGLVRCWLLGMGLAVLAFVWTVGLGPGDVLGFWLVCLASGVALGADLSLPGAMLAGVVQQAGHAGRGEGAYFGWWAFATKLNLALAAGLALPALQLLGYSPGSRDTAGLAALALAYGVLPCVLKLAAAGLLWSQHRSGRAAAGPISRSV